MKIRILTYEQIDRQEWRRLVETSATGTWFQSPEAYEFFASLPKLFRPFVVGISYPSGTNISNFKFQISSLRLRGVCVGYVTKEKGTVKQFFTRRAIIHGGPVLANDASSEEVELLMNGVKELMSERINGAPIYIETRNYNDYSRWKEAFEKAGFAYKKHLNFHIDCTDKEAMWGRLSERRKREIKKAVRSGVVIRSEGVKELGNEGVNELRNERIRELEIREWYDILQRLYKTKVKTPLWPEEFFLEAYRKGVAQYLLVKHNGHVIGGCMVVVKGLEGGCVYEWYICGKDAECKDQYPSVMATWAVMEYANTHGIVRFDVMGAGEPDVPYGVRNFKAEFGGELVEHGRFLCITKPLLYQIGKLGVKILKGK